MNILIEGLIGRLRRNRLIEPKEIVLNVGNYVRAQSTWSGNQFTGVGYITWIGQTTYDVNLISWTLGDPPRQPVAVFKNEVVRI